MEEKINYTLMPSLEQITLIKTAIALWYQDDALRLYQRLPLTLFFSELVSKGPYGWQEIENKVVEKVSKLPLAKPLKEKLVCFIKPIGLQILAWIEFHNDNSLVERLPEEVVWTSQGTIDKKKTAELLVNDESLDIDMRYKLAGIYCLEDHIDVFWKQLLKARDKDPLYIKIHEEPLLSFWSHLMEGKIDQLDRMMKNCRDGNVTPYEYAFRYSAVSGNEAATRYFLQKLTPEEKKNILISTAGDVANRRCIFHDARSDFRKDHYTDVLCFLLSQMDKEQQIKLFKCCPHMVLKCLLDWPWQSFFMETAGRMWDFLSQEIFYYLLCFIVSNKVMAEFKDFNYQEIFGQFWQQSLSDHKKYVINKCSTDDYLISKLFEVGDDENIKLMFKAAIAAERKPSLFCNEGKDIFPSINLFCLNSLFEGVYLSKDAIITFKELIRRYSEQCLEKRKDLWSKFFQSLDDFIEKDDGKRSVEEGNSSQAKRLCSLTSEQL